MKKIIFIGFVIMLVLYIIMIATEKQEVDKYHGAVANYADYIGK